MGAAEGRERAGGKSGMSGPFNFVRRYGGQGWGGRGIQKKRKEEGGHELPVYSKRSTLPLVPSSRAGVGTEKWGGGEPE